MNRPEYEINLTINGKTITKVVIDQHYQEKHKSEIDDALILNILNQIDGDYYDPITCNSEFEYFKAEPVLYSEKPYRLIFLLYIQEDTLGVINCFRVQRRKDEK